MKYLVAYEVPEDKKAKPWEIPGREQVLDWCFLGDGKRYIVEMVQDKIHVSPEEKI